MALEQLAQNKEEGTLTLDALIEMRLPMREARIKWVLQFEKQYLQDILKANDGNVSAAARAAGLGRINFYRLLWKHKIRIRKVVPATT